MKFENQEMTFTQGISPESRPTTLTGLTATNETKPDTLLTIHCLFCPFDTSLQNGKPLTILDHR